MSLSAQAPSKFLAASTKTKDTSNKGLTPSRVKARGGESLSELPITVTTITKPTKNEHSSPSNVV